MRNAQETPIAEALAALMHEERVNPTQLAARAGLSRGTVAAILSGKTPHPTARTLHRLAGALAEDPWTRERDARVMTETERVLAAAAGQADPTTQEITRHLELSLYWRLASRERAAAWDRVIARLAALPAEAVLAIPDRLADDGAPERSPDG